jgi:2-oxo-3-hexenedioate decarboxylase
VLARRERDGWQRVGRKIGFTNRTIFEEYGVYAPIFGYMYDCTVHDASDAPPLPSAESWGEGLRAVLPLTGLAQPRIEPEIAFMLRQAPPRTNDPHELLRCVEWMAHGFEIVQCHFPNWKFKAADTIVDGGLHGRYVVGPRLPIEPGDIETLANQLARFRISLLKNGSLAAEGGGELGLGSPLNALAHIIEVLETLPGHPPLEAGELITTGTLTAALPVAPGETWSTRIEGLPLPGFELRFE